MAQFFGTLTKENMVQGNVWKSMSRKFEKESYACMKTVESDEMLFILLNLPLPQHGGKSLGELAVEENRMHFLNNDRMSARSMYTYSPDLKLQSLSPVQ